MPQRDFIPSDSSKHRAHHAWFGFAFAILIVLLLVSLLVVRSGTYHRLDIAAFYVGVALVTGIVFWLVTPGGETQLSLPQHGIKLGGGAAVGAVFMYLAYMFTPGPEFRAIELPSQIRQSEIAHVTDYSPSFYYVDILRSKHVPKNSVLLVEFREGQSIGEVTLEFFTQLEPELNCFLVSRAGGLRACRSNDNGVLQ